MPAPLPRWITFALAGGRGQGPAGIAAFGFVAAAGRQALANVGDGVMVGIWVGTAVFAGVGEGVIVGTAVKVGGTIVGLMVAVADGVMVEIGDAVAVADGVIITVPASANMGCAQPVNKKMARSMRERCCFVIVGF